MGHLEWSTRGPSSNQEPHRKTRKRRHVFRLNSEVVIVPWWMEAISIPKRRLTGSAHLLIRFCGWMFVFFFSFLSWQTLSVTANDILIQTMMNSCPIIELLSDYISPSPPQKIIIDLQTTAFSPVFAVSLCLFRQPLHSCVDGDKNNGGSSSFTHCLTQRAIGWFFAFFSFCSLVSPGDSRLVVTHVGVNRPATTVLQNQPICFEISPDSLPSAPSPY